MGECERINQPSSRSSRDSEEKIIVKCIHCCTIVCRSKILKNCHRIWYLTALRCWMHKLHFHHVWYKYPRQVIAVNQSHTFEFKCARFFLLLIVLFIRLLHLGVLLAVRFNDSEFCLLFAPIHWFVRVFQCIISSNTYFGHRKRKQNGWNYLNWHNLGNFELPVLEYIRTGYQTHLTNSKLHLWQWATAKILTYPQERSVCVSLTQWNFLGDCNTLRI